LYGYILAPDIDGIDGAIDGHHVARAGGMIVAAGEIGMGECGVGGNHKRAFTSERSPLIGRAVAFHIVGGKTVASGGKVAVGDKVDSGGLRDGECVGRSGRDGCLRVEKVRVVKASDRRPGKISGGGVAAELDTTAGWSA